DLAAVHQPFGAAADARAQGADEDFSGRGPRGGQFPDLHTAWRGMKQGSGGHAAHVPASYRHKTIAVTGWLKQPEAGPQSSPEESGMSVYRVTELIGTSTPSWEDAAAEAIKTAAGTLRDLRVAEVVKQDIHLDEGGAITYRTKLQLSFKYEHEH